MIGIDEVGRGAWAGPLLVVAARESKALSSELADSKQLSKRKREYLIESIKASCELGEGWVEPFEIDSLGLTNAMKLAVKRALRSLKARNDEVIIMDGSINYCEEGYVNVQCVIKADSSHPIVSAASVYAKVLRDNHMQAQAVEFADYGFEQHVGYGTKLHKQALERLGVTRIHRLSYKPIKEFI